MGEVVQLEIFTVNAVDPPWRDNRDAMEYPFLSLQKGRTKPIKFRKGNISLGVHAPAEFGLASIWDWDLIIFAASHLNDAIEGGPEVTKRSDLTHKRTNHELRPPLERHRARP
jgi:plasmid replication initiation protein